MQFRSPRKQQIATASCILRMGFILCGFYFAGNLWLLVFESKAEGDFFLSTKVDNAKWLSKRNLTTQRNTKQKVEATPEQNATIQNQTWVPAHYSPRPENSALGVQLQSQQKEDNTDSPVENPELPSWFNNETSNTPSSNEDFQSNFLPCENFNHSTMRPKHGCQMNADTKLVFCNFQNLRIDISKIQMDRGGEPLKDVMGREESREFPIYEKGAFSVERKPEFAIPNEFRVGLYYLKDVLNKMQYPTDNEETQSQVQKSCMETWSGTTLFITRYEYVNLYHTVTDWWNTYFVLLPENHNVRVVFLDAHAQGNLDPVWEALFGNITHVKHLSKGVVCFEDARFIPPGYSATIFPSAEIPRLRCPLQSKADEFSDHVLTSYGLDNVKPIHGKIVIIDRVPYISHPRSKPKFLKRVMTNLEELKRQLVNVTKVTSVEMMQLENMSFKDQLKAIRETHILIGNHGAGLSHLMFMDRMSHILEFTSDFIDFFTYLSNWKGVQLRTLPLVESTQLSQTELSTTIATVETILNS